MKTHGFLSTVWTLDSGFILRTVESPVGSSNSRPGKCGKRPWSWKSPGKWNIIMLEFLRRKKIYSLKPWLILISLQAPRTTSRWSQFHKSLTGCQSDNGSLTRQLCRCRSASAVWHHHTLQHLVSRRRTVPVVPTWDLPVCISVMFHELWHAAVTGVSSSMVLLCGTVYWLTCIHRTFHWTFHWNWKRSFSELSARCAFVALANMHSINCLIFITCCK